MKINEVMKETGLTKKAIYYYENEGLIRPHKDPDNNYRHYNEEDVRKLIIINILRRLDVPIKTIGDVIGNSVSIKEVLKDQLVITNHKINVLYQNKKMMNELILQDLNERDFSFKTLKKFNLTIDKQSTLSGDLGNELELTFPGTLGKTFAIFYRYILNVPLESSEKVSAWNELVRRLDEMNEIEFPEEIQAIVKELYDAMDDSKLAHWERISKRLFDEESVARKPSKESGDLLAKEALVEYYAKPENQKKIEGYYLLQSFIIKNPEMFKEVEKFIKQIVEQRCSG